MRETLKSEDEVLSLSVQLEKLTEEVARVTHLLSEEATYSNHRMSEDILRSEQRGAKARLEALIQENTVRYQELRNLTHTFQQLLAQATDSLNAGSIRLDETENQLKAIETQLPNAIATLTSWEFPDVNDENWLINFIEHTISQKWFCRTYCTTCGNLKFRGLFGDYMYKAVGLPAGSGNEDVCDWENTNFSNLHDHRPSQDIFEKMRARYTLAAPSAKEWFKSLDNQMAQHIDGIFETMEIELGFRD